jgi:hypothetical protein
VYTAHEKGHCLEKTSEVQFGNGHTQPKKKVKILRRRPKEQVLIQEKLPKNGFSV